MSLRRLLYPRSIAIVGASDKIGPGFNAWKALEAVGFEGETHFVNPSRDRLFDRPCYPSLADVPDAVDAVFVAVQYDRVLDVVEQAIAKDAGGLVVLSSGFGEAGEDGSRAQARLAELAAGNGLAVCGPNCLGFLNLAGKSALFGTSLPDRLERGGVAAVVQSGSIGIALLNAARGIGLSHLITSGNEAVTTVADYVDVLVDDPEVRVIAVFLEQLRKPRAFIECCRRARAAGKPVIVLKSGRTESGQKAVMAHTGAVAGSAEAADAALRAAGAVQVFSLDALIETVLLFASLPEAPATGAAGMVSLSGGEIALALDAAEEAGLALPELRSSKKTLTELLPPYSHIANPLDLTWAGLYDAEIARQCAEAIGAEDGIGQIILLQDTPRGLGSQQAGRYARLLRAVAQGASDAGVPAVAISNLSGDQHPEYAAAAEESGVTCLRGTKEAIQAVADYFAWHGRAESMDSAALDSVAAANARTAADKALAEADGNVIGEHAAKSILAHYGIPVLREELASSVEEAVSAADRLGYPVVLKGIVSGVIHKTEHQLVRLGLRGPDEVSEAAKDLLARMTALAPETASALLVQDMIQPVAELLLGARVDPEVGPIVVVGGGGVQVELFKDVSVRLAPVGVEEAVGMIRATRSGQLLEGWRGRPKGDVQAAGEAVARLSQFVADFGDRIQEVEINPLAVLEDGRGVVPLDCVMVRHPE